jgi:2-iminobutanoate/2-iminopropanoate deaminase
MKFISTRNAPTPAGHYSQAVVQGDLVFVSGQLPIDPVSGEKKTGPIEEQTEQTLQNLAEILEAANSGIDQVLKVTIYLSNIELWNRVNAVYAKFFGEHKPARAVVPTRELHYGFQIEIEAIATVGQ